VTPATGGGAARTVLRDVRVFDGTRVLEPGVVVLEGGLIASVGGSGAAEPGLDATTVDGAGGVLLPGLIDAHVHPVDAGTLDTFASYGVTTVLDMGTWPAELVASLRGRTGTADLRSSGVGATSPDSSHAKHLVGRPESALVTDPEDAQRYVRDRVAEGVDYVKIIIDLPGFDQATVTALVSAAHASGLRTVIHASSAEAYAMAEASGTDVVTHAPLDVALDDAAVADMVAHHRIAVPTLAMMEGIAENIARANGGAKGPSYAAARDSVSALYRAGVPILAGTDANASVGVPASPPFGSSLHHELELLVGAGLSTVDALRAATVLPAEYFGLADRGAVAPGLRADLVLVAGDPVADITATSAIEHVWCAGIEVEPA
jgi:imidazolonepropionase-like amidohydrolase